MVGFGCWYSGGERPIKSLAKGTILLRDKQGLMLIVSTQNDFRMAYSFGIT